MKRWVWALGLMLLSGLLSAQESPVVQVPWTLLDQHDQAYTLNDQTRILLVARSMEGAKIVNQALAGQEKGFLEARDAVFVADVSRMPAIVSALFAVPAMREYNYRVLLDRQPRVVQRYPGEADKVLWVELGEGEVRSQREFADPAALQKALLQAGK